ncbi:CHAT domain-containing protein [Mycobacterium sp. 050134]|uniref:CHAT domain-containing protein n=1 Tax=Mycobacterium sp. 050134 TaxID=3096111 RepID=UPI002EDAD844
MPADDASAGALAAHTPIEPRELRSAYDALRHVRQLGLDHSHGEVFGPLVRRVLRAIRNDDAEALRAALNELDGQLRTATTAGMSDQQPTRRWHESLGKPRGRLTSPTRPSEYGSDDLHITPDGADADQVVPTSVGLIQRIPHIDVGADEPLQAGASFVASVYLDTKAARRFEDVNVFTAPTRFDGAPLVIDVWLTASAHFTITGSPFGQISLDPEKPASTEATFTLTVADAAPPDAGPPMLRAMLDHRLRASGSVCRSVAIDGAPAAATPNGAVSLSLATDTPEPDMLITIDRARGSRDTYQVKIQTGLLAGVTVNGEWTLEGGAADYVAALMERFVSDDLSPLGRQNALKSAGLQFFSDAPRGFRDLYWRLVDAGTPPKSILVMSVEPSIPWELMIPNARGREAGDPLGVSCRVGRWYDEDNVGPEEWIPLRDSLILAPDYETDKLPHAQEERELVRKKFPGQFAPETYVELDMFYRRNSASLLHFACHGEDATLQSIRLRKNQKLSAGEIRGGGLGKSCRATGPLVFLNACEVGRPGKGLTSPSGFAAQLIASECGAVIAPLWQVDDEIAHEVAKCFYDEVTKDPSRPFADILRDLRARAYADGGEDSYAAYCFYGHPLACAEK